MGEQVLAVTTGFPNPDHPTGSPSAKSPPRVYYLHPWIAEAEGWDNAAQDAADLGFSVLLLGWPFGSPKDLFLTQSITEIAGLPADERLQQLSDACRKAGLELWIDVAVGRAATEGQLAHSTPTIWTKSGTDALDPRFIDQAGSLRPALEQDETSRAFAGFWSAQILEWQKLGISGVHCPEATSIPVSVWEQILGPACKAEPGLQSLAWMPGAPREAVAEASAVFDFVTSSVAWWDGAAPWLATEYNSLARHVRLLGFPENPFAARRPARLPGDAMRRAQSACAAAALLADGWLLPMGFEYGMETPFLHATAEDFRLARSGTTDLRDAIREINQQCSRLAAGDRRSLRPIELGEHSAVMLRQSSAGPQLAVLNRDTVNEMPLAAAREVARFGIALAVDDADQQSLPPASGALIDLKASKAILPTQHDLPGRSELERDRIAIENIQPAVDGGRFPVKRSVGDLVEVTADIFSDGHEVLAAELLWQAQDSGEWSRAPMRYFINDGWRGEFLVERIGRHEFALQAWWSEFGTFRRDLAKKRDAGVDIHLEIIEGRLLLEKIASGAAPTDRGVIEDYLSRLGSSPDEDASVLLADELALASERADPRIHATTVEQTYPIEADREAAAFSSWYELFPRSITDSASRHGTFRDVIGRLPAIQAMGFDVLYFPPIHPIGRTNRKGPNNSLVAGADDPGSPYAIGAAEGGHDAIHPELGSLDDFLALVRAAGEHGLEIALDFAIQCSPDHPWLVQHPDWFSWRPDGSMRYAENPPKKYQDIVNVDFYGPGAIPDLWVALRDAVQFWVDQGVRIFRVDNPHTKPFPFWEWMIADIRSRDPGVLFLAEAFTRPKVMYRLGKVGFSQSYTYFTWRNTKAELTDYLIELNTAPARDVYRPHFFVNTPDINPVFLHESGRPGFLIRAALAATLSGLWGVYSGFELCEAAPVVQGKEEYLDSEKYQIRLRDWNAPGNIVAEITQLNAIRRDHRALQSHLGLTFYKASDDNILYFGKRAEPTGEMILVAVNLDPHATHSAQIEVPLWEFGLTDDASIAVEDLMHGHRFAWHGKTQTITLDPHALPFSIWRIASSEESRL